MRLQHLRGRKVNSHVLAKGELWRGKTMQIRWMWGVPVTVWQQFKERSPQGLYCGSYASTRLSKRAVDRNRMRRRCKEAFRVVLREYNLENEKNHREALGGSDGSQRWSDSIGGRVGSWEGHQGWPSHASFQLLLSPRSSSLTCDYADIVHDVRSFLSYLSQCQSKRRSGAAS